MSNLQALLQESLNLKIKIKSQPPSPNNIPLINQLKTKSKESLQLSLENKSEHGRAIALELMAFADWYLIITKLTNIENASAVHIKQDLIEESEPIEKNLLEARKIAVQLGDTQLYLRILELLTNIYNKTSQFDKEIEVLEKVINVTSRSVPFTQMLLLSQMRKLDYVYQDRDRIYQLPKETNTDGTQVDGEALGSKPQIDPFMKIHIEAWENYQWLCNQTKQFQKDQFIRDNKASLFKLCLYCGSLANPLISAREKEIIELAMKAFDEAFYISDLIQDTEYFCAATAHRSSVLYQTLPEEERNKLLDSLKQVESKMKPKNSEIRDLIHSIENKVPTLHPEEKEKEEANKK